MLIAHSDVGEGNARPENSDSSSPAALEADTRNLPYQTLRAQQCAMSLKSLPQRARCALAAIALTVNCREPLKEVFAYRDKLSDRAGISERTWFRAEQDLVDAGLITVHDQIRKRRGRFGAAHIFLTAEAVRLLRFADELVARGRRPSKASSEQEQPAAAEEQYSVDSPSANPADPFTVYLSPGSSQKRQPAPVSVPADLERLLGLGFHKFLIFKLMREARKHGKRLSDVVEAVWHGLKAAKYPIRYLQTMIAKSIDFKHVATQRRATEDSGQREQNAQKLALDVVGGCAGRAFVSADGKIRYHVSADAAILTAYHAGEKRPRTAAGMWQRWFADGVSSGAVREQARADAQAASPAVTPEARDACFATLKAALRMRGAVGPVRVIA